MMSERMTADDFRSDPMFPRLERVVAAILTNGEIVAFVDVYARHFVWPGTGPFQPPRAKPDAAT